MKTKIGTTFSELKFPERLKRILSDTNTTQQGLAEILGVQRQTVSLYVNGQIRPDIDALTVISQHFDVTTDWLLGLTNDRKRQPTATDELGLSEISIQKIKAYIERRRYGRITSFSSLDMVASHVDFEELLQALDAAFSSCSEALMAHSCGETETEGEQAAIRAANELDGTRWTVITSAKHAEYSVYNVQQLFNRIISEISDVEKVHDIMEY